MSLLSDSALSTSFGVYSRLRKYRVTNVQSDYDRQQHDKLVQKIFFESGIFESPETPLANESPDAECRSFLVRFRRQAVGAVTTIETEQALPVEEFFNVRLPGDVDRQRIAELTRFVIERDHRRQDPVVAINLLDAALRDSRRRNIRWWVWCAPSVFMWGFRSYFQSARILEQLPLTESQIAIRKGREAYFSESRSIRVVLVDLDSVSVTRSALEMLRRRKQRRQRNQRKKPNRQDLVLGGWNRKTSDGA